MRPITEEPLAAYNTGPGKVPNDQPLDLAKYGAQTQKLVYCVQSHLQKGTFKKILKIAQGVVATALVIIAVTFLYQAFSDLSGRIDQNLKAAVLLLAKSPTQEIITVYSREIGKTEEKRLHKKFILEDLVLEFQEEERPYFSPKVNIWINDQKIKPQDSEDFFGFVEEILFWHKPQILIIKLLGGKSIFSYFYKITSQSWPEAIPIFADNRQKQTLVSRSGTDFINLPNEQNLIYVYYQGFPPGECQARAEIYRLYSDSGGYKLIKIWDMEESLDWCEHFKG